VLLVLGIAPYVYIAVFAVPFLNYDAVPSTAVALKNFHLCMPSLLYNMGAVDDGKRILYFYYKSRLDSTVNGTSHFQTCNKRYRRNVWNIKDREQRKQMHFIGLFLLIFNVHRERSLWMHPRTDAWFCLADEHFTDRKWYENFRVTKRTFLFVVDLIQDDVKRKRTVMRELISVEKRVAITYYLATTAEYRTIGNLFGVSCSFVCKCVKDMCEAVVRRLQSRFVFFPRQHKLENIINTYKRKWGFPACVGAVDGTHIHHRSNTRTMLIM
jgi:hypothetical protein